MHGVYCTIAERLSSTWPMQFLSDMQHSINASSAAIRFLDQEVISLQDKQSRISATAENLHNTVLSIATSTSLELHKINDTVYSIGSTLDSPSYGDDWHLVEDTAYRILSYVWLGFYLFFERRSYKFGPGGSQEMRYGQVSRVILKISRSVIRALLSAIAVNLVVQLSHHLGVTRYLRVYLFLSTLLDNICADFWQALPSQGIFVIRVY